MSGAAYPNRTVTINLASGMAVQYKPFHRDQAGNILGEADPSNSFTPSGTSLARTDTWH